MPQVPEPEFCDPEGDPRDLLGLSEVRVRVDLESAGSDPIGVAPSAPLTLDRPVAPTFASYEESLPTYHLREIRALERQADALKGISDFLAGTSLPRVLETLAVTGAVKEILGGLATRDGRMSLDPNTFKQNAVDIAYAVEATLKKLSEHLQAKSRPLEDGESLQGFKRDE